MPIDVVNRMIARGRVAVYSAAAAVRPRASETKRFVASRLRFARGKIPWTDLRAFSADMSAEAREFLRSRRAGFEEATRRRLGQLQGLFAGSVIGAGAGALLGGGGIGIVALGGAIGLPLIAVTAIVGAALGQFAGNELDWLREQWSAAAHRQRLVFLKANPASDEIQREQQTAAWSFVRDRDHRQYLLRAIAGAERSITIRSAFLSDHVVDAKFCSQLRDAMLRGVNIFIEYGYQFPWESRRRRKAREQAEQNLRTLWRETRGKCPGDLSVARTPTHVKELAVDDRVAVIGSNNWLSNAGGRNSENSIILDDPEIALQIRREAQGAIEKFRRREPS